MPSRVRQLETVAEALKSLGIQMVTKDPTEDVWELGRGFYLELTETTFMLQALENIPATRQDPGDVAIHDLCAIPVDTPPASLAEQIATRVAHEIIKYQIMAYEESLFEEEMQQEAERWMARLDAER